MATHLTDEKLMDTLFGTLDVPASAHLAACPACAARLEEVRAGLDAARTAEVPEPSPLYWEAFRRQVGGRIEREGAARRWRWTLVPAFAAAAALLVLVPLSWRGPAVPSPAPALPAWSALPPADEDDGLDVLEGVALAEAELPAVTSRRAVVESLAELTADEVEALGDALRGDGLEDL